MVFTGDMLEMTVDDSDIPTMRDADQSMWYLCFRWIHEGRIPKMNVFHAVQLNTGSIFKTWTTNTQRSVQVVDSDNRFIPSNIRHVYSDDLNERFAFPLYSEDTDAVEVKSLQLGMK